MKINKVKIEGFLSIKEAEIDFSNYKGLIRVVGKNNDTRPPSSNGAGKSSIIESIVFALFGRTIRKTNEKSITHSVSKSQCKVTLLVNDNITITRTKSPPSLIVDVNGKNCTLEGIQQTQANLEKILNTNYNVFLASIVFGQQNTINFLSSSPEEKRSIIQSFLNVTDLFKNRSRIKSLKTKYNNSKKVAVTLHSESVQSVNSLKDKKSILRKNRKDAYALLSPEKEKFIRKMSFTDIKDLENKRNELELEYRGKEHALTSLEDTIVRLKKEIEFLSSNESCEHCGKVPFAHYNKKLRNEKTLEASYKERDLARKQLKTASLEIDKVQVPISSSDYEMIEGVKNTEVEMKVITSQIKSQQRITKKHSKEIEEAQKKYDVMRFWEHAFSEQGLVKYVIQHILEYFNERSNYYLSVLTKGTFSIEFDDLLIETIKSKKNKIFFDALSGGEKKKVSLAVMLALNDLLILSGKSRSNIVFFDEIADSLDHEGVKGLCELIEEISTDKKLFVITHNEYMTSLIEDSSDVLSVTKKKGVTSFK